MVFAFARVEKLGARGIAGKRVFLIEASGTPEDQKLSYGSAARSYADFVTEAGLYSLSGIVDGISVDRSMIVHTEALVRALAAWWGS